jgi:hypothetical protein
MPIELEIIRAREFIRLGAHGHFDLKASKAVLAVLAGACRKRGINQALLDLRALRPGPKPVFSPADLVSLVNTFREVGFTRAQRVAVLYSSDPHHRARLFAFISNLQGWSVQAFESFEEAVDWLSSGEESNMEIGSKPAAQEIPVRSLKTLKSSPKKKPISRRRRPSSVSRRR